MFSVYTYFCKYSHPNKDTLVYLDATAQSPDDAIRQTSEEIRTLNLKCPKGNLLDTSKFEVMEVRRQG